MCNTSILPGIVRFDLPAIRAVAGSQECVDILRADVGTAAE